MRAILPALVCLLLTACGLKDDLYLPDPAASEAAGQPAEEEDRAEDT